MKRPYGRNHRMLYRRLLLLVGAVALVGVVIALVFQRADQAAKASNLGRQKVFIRLVIQRFPAGFFQYSVNDGTEKLFL